MRYRNVAFNVCNAECGFVSGLGREINGLSNVPALITAARQADESAGQFGFCLIFPASVHHTIIPRERGFLWFDSSTWPQ